MRYAARISWVLLSAHSAGAGQVFASHEWQGEIPREHYLGCLWNFRTVITVCLATEDSLRGNRYANVTSMKALNPPADQVLTGNQCFRSVLVAHELQEKFLHFYQGGGHGPPIEETLWIVALTAQGQDELFEVCPGMLITALLFHSELRLSFKADDLWGKMQRFKAHTLLRQMVSVPNKSFEMDHYRVMMRTWPIANAGSRSLKLQKTLASSTGTESAAWD
eukprot:Skav216132  [mRNA]  locus=scaffold1946:327478:328140:+ [translate_table: standard]